MQTEPKHPPAPYLRVVIGTTLLWGVLQFAASATGSLRGEWGILIAGLIISAGIATQVVLFHQPVRSAALAIGLGPPSTRSLFVAAGLALVLLGVLLGFGVVTGAAIQPVPGAAILAIGIFSQGGVSEELIFRGFLFRHLRSRHSFWAAVGLSLIPFTAVHLLLFATLPVPLAAASVGLAVITSVPLAHLFELGRGTIWAPALLHAAIQGIKLVDLPEEMSLPLALIWLGASATIPLLVLLVPARARNT